jgi:hypothetical protein
MSNNMSFDCGFLEINRPIQCRPVETITGEKALNIQTSHLWIDNSPLSFYVIDLGAQILITDDSETMFNFKVNNILTSKKSRHLIKDKLNCTHSDINLSENDEIIGIASKDKFNFLLADYISAMCALMHYEREIAGISNDVNNLADEVEIYLKAWKPKQKLKRNPIIKGISNHEYRFDFELENNLILTINPTPNAVGSVMRKVGDVVSGNALNGREIMVIVDNRGGGLFNQKAEEEIKIISSLAKALPLTNLINKYQQNISKH